MAICSKIWYNNINNYLRRKPIMNHKKNNGIIFLFLGIILIVLGIVFGVIASLFMVIFKEITDKKFAYSMLGDEIIYNVKLCDVYCIIFY